MMTLSLYAIVFDLLHQLYFLLTVIEDTNMLVKIIETVKVTVYFSLNFRHRTAHIGLAFLIALPLYFGIK